LHKKKSSGGRKRAFRKKRRSESGSFAVETISGNSKRKYERKKGGNRKIRVLREKFTCVTDPKSGKTEKVEIQRVIRNPANVNYDRRGVITKGTIIKTSLGSARVTSRPGQDGTINAVLAKEK